MALEDISQGEIMFPSPRTTKKDEETGDFAHEITSKHPNCDGRRLNCLESTPSVCQAPKVYAMLPKCAVTLEVHENYPYTPRKAPQVCWEQAKTFFFFYF